MGDGPGSTHTDLYLGVRVTLRRGHLHSGHPSGKSLVHSSHRNGREGLAVDRSHGAHKVATLHRSITDHHSLVKESGIFLKNDIDSRFGSYQYIFSRHSYTGKDENLALRIRNGNLVLSVNISDCSGCGPVYKY